MTPILTSSSHVLPNLCSYSLTSHSHLSTASVVCRIDSARFHCNKYCVRTRWRPLLLLSYVAFNPRHASSPLLTSVFFLHCCQCAPFAQQCQGQVQLSIALLKTLLHDRCGCDLGIFHRSPAQCFNRLGIRRSHVRSELTEMTTLANPCAHQGTWEPYQSFECPRVVLPPSVQLRLAVAFPSELSLPAPDVQSTPLYLSFRHR